MSDLMRASTTTLLVSFLIALPSASATGHLVNLGIGSSQFTFGANAFGGSGDTLDVGLFNEQCSDEADVVDVGVANREGMGSDACRARGCQHEQGRDPIGPILEQSFFRPEADETPARCSDGEDTVDVGVLNQEGGWAYDPRCDEYGCEEWDATGDERDATDVGVLNQEFGDDEDGNDAGVVNCEWDDGRDATDVGVVNFEQGDRDDTFDLSVLNTEVNEGGDANGLNVGGGSLGLGFDCLRIDVGLPIDPSHGLRP